MCLLYMAGSVLSTLQMPIHLNLTTTSWVEYHHSYFTKIRKMKHK